MKILLYNWVNFDDEERRGGGVRVYHQNLIEQLRKIPGIRIHTLSSGICYDLLQRRLYIRERPETEGVRSFEVVNSPITAPAQTVFSSTDVYLHDQSLKSLVQEFIEREGPFDVIQFDNLEGISAGVLELKEVFPETRFIYYMHNYNLVCPQVNLWFAESETCDDYNDGKRCSVCIPHPVHMKEVKIAHAISGLLKRLRIRHDSYLFRLAYRNLDITKALLRAARRVMDRIRPSDRALRTAAPRPPVPNSGISKIYSSATIGEAFKAYRERNLLNIRKHFDLALAVSNRVKTIAVGFGIPEQKVEVVYIGSRFAQRSVPIRVAGGDHLQLAYLGYERNDKGFYHFVEALEAMPRSAALRIGVLVAAKLRSREILDRLKRVSVKFKLFEIVDGYDHKALPELLKDVGLGIVPVLWEDNLPQVAIEFVAHGVPVLSSELGGAKELCGGNRRFVYRHGNVDDLIGKILFFLDNRSALRSYEDHRLQLVDMAKHVNIMLDRIYRYPLNR